MPRNSSLCFVASGDVFSFLSLGISRRKAVIGRKSKYCSAASQDKPFMHPTAFDDGYQALYQKPWRHNSSAISNLDTISRVGKEAK